MKKISQPAKPASVQPSKLHKKTVAARRAAARTIHQGVSDSQVNVLRAVWQR